MNLTNLRYETKDRSSKKRAYLKALEDLRIINIIGYK